SGGVVDAVTNHQDRAVDAFGQDQVDLVLRGEGAVGLVDTHLRPDRLGDRLGVARVQNEAADTPPVQFVKGPAGFGPDAVGQDQVTGELTIDRDGGDSGAGFVRGVVGEVRLVQQFGDEAAAANDDAPTVDQAGDAPARGFDHVGGRR